MTGKPSIKGNKPYKPPQSRSCLVSHTIFSSSKLGFSLMTLLLALSLAQDHVIARFFSAANIWALILLTSNFISLFGKIAGAVKKCSSLYLSSALSSITRCFSARSVWQVVHSVPRVLQDFKQSALPHAGAPLTQLPGTVVL